MKKLVTMVLTLALAGGMLATPTFATNYCFFCNGAMNKTVHYTPWLTVGYQDCEHDFLYAKDALIERTKVTTFTCRNCGKGYTTNLTIPDKKCLANKNAASTATDGDPCFFCSENSVTVKTHHTPWLTTATNENGVSTQERLIVKTSICGNCGRGGTTNETETRTVRLHG